MVYCNKNSLPASIIRFCTKIHFKFFCIIFLSAFVTDLYSQSIIFNHLTSNNGLSNNYVSDIFQDRYGFLWFATDDGLIGLTDMTLTFTETIHWIKIQFRIIAFYHFQKMQMAIADWH